MAQSSPKADAAVAKTLAVLFGLLIAGVSLACTVGSLGGGDAVECGGVEMEEGDSCVNLGGGGSNSYQEQSEVESRTDVLGGIGGVCGIIVGLVIAIAALAASPAEFTPRPAPAPYRPPVRRAPPQRAAPPRPAPTKATEKRPARPAPPPEPVGPVAFDSGGTEIATDAADLTVRTVTRGPGGAEVRTDRARLARNAVQALEFQLEPGGAALFARKDEDGPAVRLVSADLLTRTAWKRLDASIRNLSNGRLRLDLERRERLL
ncbi:hypothetical protein [Glycomyces paridis]|uniref:Uncharacterized protein n=1 Tax=Glycomyces paridis TaxID=2126555 RepID=A0A4S8PCP8_9ACTN|nr:hypothetical protein [Glycomyces paridis]THV26982.1 hypothetical protein E9998_15980 [Glycomyces paridis]